MGSESQQAAQHEARAQRFEELYLESFGQVYRYVLSRVSDPRTAEDVTSEAFLRAARSFRSYDERRSQFATWVTAIARNCIVDHFGSNPPIVPLDEVPDDATAFEERPAVLDEDAEYARALMAVLSKNERNLIRMRYFEGKRNVQIASELNINQSTVASRLQRALIKMRDASSNMYF